MTEAYGTGRVSNISVIESPTVPYLVKSDITKRVGGVAAGGIALGLKRGRFLIEMYF